MQFLVTVTTHPAWQKRDIDNPDQRISDSAEQTLDYKVTRTLQCCLRSFLNVP